MNRDQERERRSDGVVMFVLFQVLDLVIELFNKGGDKDLDIPSVNLPEIPTIPVYVHVCLYVCTSTCIYVLYSVIVILRARCNC